MRTNAFKLGEAYENLQDKKYEFEYLILATSNRILMSSKLFESTCKILN